MFAVGRRLAVVVAAVLACSSCAFASGPGNQRDWSEVAATGWPDGTQVVVDFSTFMMPSGFHVGGYVGFVDGHGDTTLLRTGPGQGGVAAAGGVACVETETSTYRFTAEAAQRWSRGGKQWLGAWTGVGPGGECRSGFNEAMSFRGRGEVRQRCHVPAVPGTGGQSATAVYVSSIGLGKAFALYRCAGRAEEASRVMTWDAWRDPRHHYGPISQWETDYATPWYLHDGKWWSVESVTGRGSGGGSAFGAGHRGMIRLASLDLRTHTYRSTLLSLTPWLPFEGGASFSLTGAARTAGGYLHDGSLWVVDTGGRLTEIDLADRSAHAHGRLHPPFDASGGAVAWHGDELWALFTPVGDRDSQLVRYGLADAVERSRTPVTGLRDLPSDQYLTTGMAVVAPDGAGS